MATVRITKELTNDILGAARVKFQPKIKAAEDSAPTTTQWGDYIYDKILEGYIPIMEQLPEHFFKSVASISVIRLGGESCNLNFDLSGKRRWPEAIPNTDYIETIHFDTDISLSNDLVWGELYSEVVAWKRRGNDARTQAQEFVEGVSKLLESYSTLAPALKAWPPLWDLLTERVKDKHKEIVDRKKPEREAPSVDINRLTAVMTASKLGGL